MRRYVAGWLTGVGMASSLMGRREIDAIAPNLENLILSLDCVDASHSNSFSRRFIDFLAYLRVKNNAFFLLRRFGL